MSFHDRFKTLMVETINGINKKVKNEGIESLYSYDKAIMIEGIAPDCKKGRIVEVIKDGFIDSDGHIISFFDIDTEHFFIFCDEFLETRKY